MSDIVKRLRAITETPFPSMTIGLRNIETITESADEIERLRSEHDAWRDAAIEQQQKLKRSEAERQRNAEVMEQIKKVLDPFGKLADSYDGMPPPKYFGDTDFTMRYSGEDKATVTVAQLRAVRALLSRLEER